MDRIIRFLQTRKDQGLLRVLHPAQRRQAGKIFFNGRTFIDLSSNDYLGLSRHPHLLQAAKAATDRLGTSASASRLLSGDTLLTHQLEERIARLKGKEAALVFNSGYQANLGIISSLCQKGDVIFFDRLSHASIIDGILLSGAKFFRFRHNDPGHLALLLSQQRNKYQQALIVSETIFSMDGDRCPLKEIVQLKKEYKCRLLVDEAHATGIFGASGSGLVEEQGQGPEVDLIMGTFGKALGSFGAYITGAKRIITFLINSARSFIYSTALPPAVIAANLASLELIEKEPQRRRILLENADYFRRELRKRGLNIKGAGQIVPLILQDTQKTISASYRLQQRGYWVLAIRPPTVAPGQARLRFSLTYHHKRQLLQRLIDDIEKICPAQG